MTMTTGQKVMYTGEKRSARIHGTSGVWGGGGGGGGSGMVWSCRSVGWVARMKTKFPGFI